MQGKGKLVVEECLFITSSTVDGGGWGRKAFEETIFLLKVSLYSETRLYIRDRRSYSNYNNNRKGIRKRERVGS